jgi:hypothetical protein
LAFESCDGLTSITIQRPSSSSITALGEYAFEYCFELVNIYVPDSDSMAAYSTASGWSSYASIIKTA